jgi:hypothetical protein
LFIISRHVINILSPLVTAVKKYKKTCKYFIKRHVYINTLLKNVYDGFEILHIDGSGEL